MGMAIDPVDYALCKRLLDRYQTTIHRENGLGAKDVLVEGADGGYSRRFITESTT